MWFDPCPHPIHTQCCQGMFICAAEAAFYGSSKTVEDHKRRIRWNKMHYVFGNRQQSDDSIYCGFNFGLSLREKGT